jgi:RNA polymerase sigma-70 factor (ECF subfamily)
MPQAAALLELARNPGLTDEEVVARVRGGETALFEILMRRHNQRVYRAIRAILRDEDEIEEAMQQAHVSAFEHLGSFAGDARYSTWLTRIAINEALGRKRRGRRLVSLDASDTEEPMSTYVPRPPSPEERAAGHELAVVLEAAIAALGEPHRLVIMLRDVEGLDTAEVADVLDVSEDVVKQRLHRARAALRQDLEARLGAAGTEAFRFGSTRCDRVVAAVLARISQ